MKRIKVKVRLMPLSAAHHASRVVDAYAPTATARFAVTRERDDLPWFIVHRRSGGRVSAAVPAIPRKATLAELLNVVAAWEASSHLNWTQFDGLPEATPETKAGDIRFANMNAAFRLAKDMRTVAALVLGL